MRYKLILLLILGVDVYVLLNEMSQLSITYYEAEILYNSYSLIHYISTLFISLFGNNEIGLRFTGLFFHTLSVLLLYKISSKYSRNESDRVWLILIYVLLPGVNSAAILLDSSSLVIFLLLLFAYVAIFKKRYISLLMLVYIFMDESFIWLYLSLVIYFLVNRRVMYSIFSFLLFISMYYIYGVDFGGSPRGYVLDELGIYGAIFSPIIFIYIIYSLYRYFVLKKLDILWYLSLIPFIISIILSFRQRVELQLFAPYMMLALPITMQMFFHSYRVRLKMYRYRYRVIFILAFALLVINIVAVFVNERLYAYLDDPKKHFAYRSHVAKELAKELKKRDIECVDANDYKMQLRLKFYSIEKCDKYRLSDIESDDSEKVTISYIDSDVFSTYVSKIHK